MLRERNSCYSQKNWLALLLFIVSVVAFLFFHFINSKVAFMISAIFFGIIITLVSSRLVLGNPVINWFGNHLFEIFIIHKLPLTLIGKIGISNRVLFVFISFVLTIGIAAALKKLLSFLDAIILGAK